MQFSSSVPSGQSCQPSHTDSSAWHSPFPQENSAGLQVSVKQEGPAWQGMGSSMGTGREQAGRGLGRADGGWPPCGSQPVSMLTTPVSALLGHWPGDIHVRGCRALPPGRHS